MDDRLLGSRQPFEFPAYCVVCDIVLPTRLTWHFAGSDARGAVHPAWTETCVCTSCGLNSRMRAVMAYLKAHYSNARKVYFAEESTKSFKVAKAIFGDVVGSEYLGPERQPGRRYLRANRRFLVRHEDLVHLSFPSEAFNLVVTQDVFEHIPQYRDAFKEILRVLAPAGSLVFTVPFFAEETQTRIRAVVNGDGAVQHILPPEIHGNPVDKGGSLCFQNFGWDILDDLTECGFVSAEAHLYWGPWQGHLGMPFFVFSAQKPGA